MDTIYTAEALATGGGRNGHVRTADGLIDTDVRIPKEMGGAGGAPNPELLFAAGYAACFHSALQSVARAQKITLGETSVGTRVGIGPNGQGGFGLSVELEVVIPDMPHDEAQALAEAAEKVCPYSNATRGNIETVVRVVED
ncbi:organic hydroperoxide resistance protein [Microbacterium telephonicum]|uniref:Ohr subfamily peroxiredoxin n=1 Tax=Microbacterium telephonicum TaxID=1714841 RepID=A0A498C254_9MICO|nr:organic hydroperoxide resistance protein [Microbacterium telephonicum]RLK46551.1 Ohr subfamily peroxiredoxin [Microbacterium telephonicum]